MLSSTNSTHSKFSFPFPGYLGHHKKALRSALVELLNDSQDKYTFAIFTNNAPNFHTDGCIYAVKCGDTARNRNSESVVFCREYRGSLPSVYPDGETLFDEAYIAARGFIRKYCGV